MVVLKKIRASTLMETLVATVLIVIIFMISSMIMNNMLTNNARHNTEQAEELLNAMEYRYKNKGFELPHYEQFDSWEVSVYATEKNGIATVTLEAENPNTNVTVTNHIPDGN